LKQNNHTSPPGRIIVAAVVCAALLAVVGRATVTAQLARVSAQTPLVDGRTLPQGQVWGTDVAYDPGTGRYLVVGGFGVIFGICTDAGGNPVSGPFIIANSAAYSHYPRVQYSPDVSNGAGGAGGFLVSWHQYVAEKTPDNFYAALASCATASLLTGPQLLGGGSAAYEGSGASLAYSQTSRRFLAVMPTSDYAVLGRFVDTNGVPTGGVFPITNPGSSLFPAVAWNPTTDEFGVSYSGFNGAGAFAAFVRVKQDTSLWNRTSFGAAPAVFVTDVAYNAATGHYVMGWSLGGGSRYADLDNAGNLLASGLISSVIGGSTSFSLEYNGTSGTFLAVGHNHDPADGTSSNSNLVIGAELNSTGFPITGKTYLTSNGGLGSFYPRVFGQVGAPNWNVVFSLQHLIASDQIISTTSTGGGPAGGSSSSSSSGGSTSSGSSSSSGGSSSGGTTGGCTTPDPFVAIGGGHCVSGGWLPGPAPTGTGSSSSSSSSGGGSTSSSSSGGGSSSGGATGGCTTPDPFVAIGGGHCVNGGWLPGPAPAGSSSSSSSSSGGSTSSSGGSSSGGTTGGCTTPDPFVAIGGGHCVNGGWLPGPAPAGSSSSSSSSSSSGGGSSSGGTGGCTTPDPFVAIGGGVCVGGGWQPASTYCGGMPDPFTAIGGGVCINGGWVPRGGH